MDFFSAQNNDKTNQRDFEWLSKCQIFLIPDADAAG
jgi:hypothetical protein